MAGQTLNSFGALGKSLGITDKQESKPYNGGLVPPHNSVQKKMPIFLNQSEDYVSIAEKQIKSLGRPSKQLPGKLYFGNLTTSKIRNILSLANKIYNEVILLNGELPQNIVNDIRYMKIRLVYEAGREPDVMKFCKVTEIIDAVDFIDNSRDYFLRYSKYLEALVAYHRYYSDRDNEKGGR